MSDDFRYCALYTWGCPKSNCPQACLELHLPVPASPRRSPWKCVRLAPSKWCHQDVGASDQPGCSKILGKQEMRALLK